MSCHKDVGQLEISSLELHYPECSSASSPPAQSVLFQQTGASSSPPCGMSRGPICTHVGRSAHAGSAHGSVTLMFCGSATEETGVCERHPGVFGCEVSAARRSKCRVLFLRNRARLSASERRTAGGAQPSPFVAKSGY